jgi:hypothetical protein
MRSRAAPSARFWSTSADWPPYEQPDERRCGRGSSGDRIWDSRSPAGCTDPRIVTPFHWDADVVTAHRQGYGYGRQRERTAHHRERECRAHVARRRPFSGSERGGCGAAAQLTRRCARSKSAIDTPIRRPLMGTRKQAGQSGSAKWRRREDTFATTRLPPSRAGRERETHRASSSLVSFHCWYRWTKPARVTSCDAACGRRCFRGSWAASFPREE